MAKKIKTTKVYLSALERAGDLVERLLQDSYEYCGNFSRIGKDGIRRGFVALCKRNHYVEVFPALIPPAS